MHDGTQIRRGVAVEVGCGGCKMVEVELCALVNRALVDDNERQGAVAAALRGIDTQQLLIAADGCNAGIAKGIAQSIIVAVDAKGESAGIRELRGLP